MSIWKVQPQTQTTSSHVLAPTCRVLSVRSNVCSFDSWQWSGAPDLSALLQMNKKLLVMRKMRTLRKLSLTSKQFVTILVPIFDKYTIESPISNAV